MAGQKSTKSIKSTQSKYKNIKVSSDGCVFDSKKELRRWEQLKELESLGEITNLKRQVKYLLVPTQSLYFPRISKTGKLMYSERKIEYIADFVYEDRKGDVVVEDVKSSITRKKPEYIIKRKLMMWVHRIQVVEV